MFNMYQGRFHGEVPGLVWCVLLILYLLVRLWVGWFFARATSLFNPFCLMVACVSVSLPVEQISRPLIGRERNAFSSRG